MLEESLIPTYDPVFLKYGEMVYSREFIANLRDDILNNGNDYDLIPQEGFQELVCLNDADVLIVGGKRGAGKLQSINNLVVTPFGMRRLGDLTVGSIISDPITGGMQRVLQIFEHPNKDIYRVFFSDGTHTECGLEHLWLIKRTNFQRKSRAINGYGQEADWTIWTFEQIKEFLDKQERGEFKNKQKNNLLIPLCAPVKFTKSGNSVRKTDIDPYVIGALIGDGCLVDSVRTKEISAEITTMDYEVVEQIINAGVEVVRVHQKEGNKSKQYALKSAKLEESLRLCRLIGHKANSKFIPTCYKWGTIEERYAFIQGMMDTDGYIDEEGRCSYNTVSEELANDFRFVIQSLGGTVTITKKKAGYKDENGVFVECQPSYECYIRIADTHKLFRLPRRLERCKPFNGGVSERCRRITHYEYVGKEDARCITVSGRDRLYMTNDFIVTHNSFVMELAPLRFVDNPLFTVNGYRKEEDDIMRGLWNTSKKIYSNIATMKESTFRWVFPSGAVSTYEHLQNEKEIDRRFRGVEIPFIIVDEVTQISFETFFTLLASNRNSLGIKNQFIGSCNPVGPKHWLHQFIKWYIDEDTKEIIPERDGKTRYFYKYGKHISEIYWGNTKEEVYEKAKDKIDLIFDETLRQQGLSPLNLINSLCFIGGDYASNKIFIKKDTSYLGNLAQQGGEQSIKDIKGIWDDYGESESIFSNEDWEEMYTNTYQTDGIRTAVADVALTRDALTIGAFEGNHLFAIEYIKDVGSQTAITIIKKFLDKHHIPMRNFAFDSDGVGNYLKEPCKVGKGGAYAFNNNSASSDSAIWYNQKAECAEKFAIRIKERGFSIDKDLLDKKMDGKTLREHLDEQKSVIRRKETTNGKYQLIGKPEMKKLLGGKRSPDIIEMIIMHEHFNINKPKGDFKGLKFFNR